MTTISDAILHAQPSFPSLSEWRKKAATYRAIDVIWKRIESQLEYPVVLKDLDQAQEVLGDPDNFETFRCVTQLDLSNTGIELLPDEICNLKCLRTLNLSNNRLTDLSPVIHNFADLEFLQLEHNPLEPSQFRKIARILIELPNLKKFSSDSQLLIDTFNAEYTQTLAICSAWEQIRPSLVSYPELATVIHNVRELDAFFKLDTLTSDQICTTLDLCKKKFYLSFDKVHKLSLRNLKLQFFPPVLCCLTELRELDLSHNSFKKVPRELASFTKLETLIFLDNPLPPCEDLEKTLKADMPRLKTLFLPAIQEGDQAKSKTCIIM